jgi:hypothetical protein
MAADAVSAVDNRLMGIPGEKSGIVPFPTQGLQRKIGKAAAVGLVPATAATAALGGVAAGQAVGAVGQMMGIDPELPGSSNTVNSRLNMQGQGYLPMY